MCAIYAFHKIILFNATDLIVKLYLIKMFFQIIMKYKRCSKYKFIFIIANVINIYLKNISCIFFHNLIFPSILKSNLKILNYEIWMHINRPK